MEQNFDKYVLELQDIIERGYSKKIVCYIDILGMKNRITEKTSDDLARIYATIKMFVDNPSVQKNRLNIFVFSDCMYITTDKKNIENLFDFLAKLTYQLLNNYYCQVTSECNVSLPTDKQKIYDCVKIRGGITYGDVLELNGVKNGEEISKLSNIITGPAVKDAYILESEKAKHPKILLDEKILCKLGEIESSKEKFCLIPIDNRYYYFDFLRYLCQQGENVADEISGCLEFVMKELKDLKTAYDKLESQLSWYKKYIEKYK